jgi:hypothetical protein
MATRILAAAFLVASLAAATAGAAAGAQEPTLDAGASAPAPGTPEPAAPFAFADFSWMPGNAGASDHPLSFGPFTGELRVDVDYNHALSNPADDTISGSSEVFRSNEIQLTQLGVGGDFYYKGVMARLMTQFGLYSETTPRNDASTARGQWNLADAFRYISEAYGGYHLNVMNGINIQGGIFMSYIGLWSYYNFDNWTYQPSYVSSNTPWFFNGARVQIFTSDKLKIEPWLINGWQSYGMFNEQPGVGVQIQWRPNGWFGLVSNNYFGADVLGVGNRKRIHSDDSVMFKYYEDRNAFLSKAAASFTFDIGCEWGGFPGNANSASTEVNCASDSKTDPGQYFIGFMAYNRLWFWRDRLGFTVGGGAIDNPGRYLVLLPPINGATAASGTPYFTENPGDSFKAWDAQVTFDYMPLPYITFRAEYTHRASNVPYFAGSGGVTPPGGNQGAPGSVVAGWTPDLILTEDRVTVALLVKM